MGLKGYVYSVLVGKYEEWAVLSKPTNRGNDNIKMDVRAYQAVNWIHLPQDKDQWWGSFEQENEPSCSTKGV